MGFKFDVILDVSFVDAIRYLCEGGGAGCIVSEFQYAYTFDELKPRMLGSHACSYNSGVLRFDDYERRGAWKVYDTRG